MTSTIAARAPLATPPPGILCAEDYETVAESFLAPSTYAYLAGGSERDLTVAANRAAFDGLSLCPRVLRDVTSGHTRLRLAGRELAHPLLLAPLAHQRLYHPRGELETAHAATATDTCLVASTLSSVTLEDIAASAGPDRWFQLYIQPQRQATLDLLSRAATAGYRAIVVTLDVPIQPASHRALRAGFRMPDDIAAANLGKRIPMPAISVAPGMSFILQGLMQAAPTWSDVKWLAKVSPLPLWAKGVFDAEDARRLADLGATGVVVSNHGGRSLDGVPASLAALMAIRRALPKPFPVLVDGGIRRGADIFKALALGADAVLVGRLQAYALAVAGALGVAHMIKLLREELETCMALTGCATLADIESTSVADGSLAPWRLDRAPC